MVIDFSTQLSASKGESLSLLLLPVICVVQGAALVNIYKDGSVLVSHSGTDMGQGINTKAIQVRFRLDI